MPDVILRIPSKVPYGYVEIKFLKDEVSPEELAETYADYIRRYKEAEEKALTAPTKVQSKHQVQSVDKVLSEDEVKDLLVKELGAIPVPDEDSSVDNDADAPWNNKPEPVKKDYAVDDSSWDFS